MTGAAPVIHVSLIYASMTYTFMTYASISTRRSPRTAFTR